MRDALAHVPTAVCVVTGYDGGEPIGLTVGSFTSISLDPPLVGFFVDNRSKTLARLVASGSFTVNVLGESQKDVGMWFAKTGVDRFAGLDLVPGARHPRLAGSLGWIECHIDSTSTLGDHDLVVGRVASLDIVGAARPLVFYRGSLWDLDAHAVGRLRPRG